MDSSETIIDPHSEVKKLQELVKKLEKQNELLRNKQKLQLNSLQNGEVDKVVSNHNNNFSSNHADIVRQQGSGLLSDDVDLIDMDNLSLKDDEDSWLYSSPKPPTPQQNSVSPYKWMRKEFDHPSPEIESTKRSLIFRLDEVARMNRSSSTPALGSYTSPTKSSPLSRSTDGTSSTQKPVLKQSLLTSMGSRVDTGTFTRPKKHRSRQESTEHDTDFKGDSTLHRVPDVTDIENLAKLQEESLRQSISPYTSPRKGLKSRHQSQLAASDADNGGSPAGSNRSSPGRFDSEAGYHRNSLGSDASSPPDSPYASQHLHPQSGHQQTPELHNLKRSLPNVSRLQYPSPALHSSDSSLDHNSVGSDENNLAPEARPTARLSQSTGAYRAPSPGMTGLKQPAQIRRGASPQRSGLPQPRRTIPRPTTPARASLPAPRRSNIPSPRPPSSQGSEESWRDGCF